MSSPNQYDPHRQHPQHPQYGQGQYNQAPAPSHAVDDDLVAIPMKKSSPMVVMAIAGGAVLVVGVAAFSMFGGKKSAGPAPAATSTVNQAEAAEKAKAMKEHLEITQRSLAKMKEAEAAQNAAKAQAEPAQAPAEAQATAPPSQPAEPRTAHASSRGHTAVAAAPPPKPVKVVSKKKMDSLDDMGAGISSALGK
jgi:hypothetical protein